MSPRIVFKSEDEMPEMSMSLTLMDWNRTGSWRYLRPVYRDKTPPCNEGCPAGNDIEGMMVLMAEGRVQEALDRLLLDTPFPATMGRICYHPCMERCNRGQFDEAVRIKWVERFAGDAGLEAGGPKPPPVYRQGGKNVAVIGGGPAGLSCAYHLARLGHRVTVYEKSPKLGGALRAIPDYRLPSHILDAEIERILALGVRAKAGVEVGRDLSFDQLNGFDAVFIATGAPLSRKLGIKGEDLRGVVEGLEFLLGIKEGAPFELGHRVAVIGGGNTAIDAARSAMRLGAHPFIVYRRGRDEMPALKAEIEEAEEEGVHFMFLCSPVEIKGDDGRVKSIVCIKNKLGPPGPDGRPRPVPIEGSEFSVDVDGVIVAVGEMTDVSALPPGVSTKNGLLMVDEKGFTGKEGFWAGGDITTLQRMAVHAIGHGKRGAIFIDAFLRGADLQKVLMRAKVGQKGGLSMARYLQEDEGKLPSQEVVGFEGLNLAYFEEEKAIEMPRLPLGKRQVEFGEVELGYSQGMAVEEASRCFNCAVCNGCGNCYIFCPDMSILKGDDGHPFVVDYEHCKGCGICVEECPRSAMVMEEEGA